MLPTLLKASDDAVIYSPAPVASTSAPAPVATPAPSTHTAPTSAQPLPKTVSASLPPASGKKYVVKPGDNLYRIGRAHQTTLEAIKALNGLKSDTIKVGQVLMLPLAGYSYRPPQPPQQPRLTPIPTQSTQVASVAPAPAPAPSVQSAPKPMAPVATVRPTVAQSTAPATPVSPNSVVRVPYQLTMSEAQSRLMSTAENLARLDLGYDESWMPPGESTSWDMDCSNTSRYLYKKALGIELPRTASDQYYNLKIRGEAWDVPTDSNNHPDLDYLKRNLRVGDLLFWENTYEPERDPPITHVTMFMGTDDKGRWIMMGSLSSSVGKYGSSRGGPDIYLFDPLKPTGGYSAWLGFVHKTGRFVAFGRPLLNSPALSVSSR